MTITEKELKLANAVHRDMYTFTLRECIGKTDDIHEPLCMHTAIVAREMARMGVIVCRVCNRSLNNHEGRYNDHKLLRHPGCVQPICSQCARENPDAYHLAFKRGVQIMGADREIRLSLRYT